MDSVVKVQVDGHFNVAVKDRFTPSLNGTAGNTLITLLYYLKNPSLL